MESKKLHEEEKKKKQEKKIRQEEQKEKNSMRNHDKLLPISKNRTGNLQSQVSGNLLYHDVFFTFMSHFVQDDTHLLKDLSKIS